MMKKHILFAFFLVLTKSSQAQFFDSSVHYLTVNKGFDGLSTFYTHCDYHLLLDSVFNDTQFYHVEYVKGSSKYIQNLKTIDKKVFVFVDSKCLVLYDFGLNVGDTIKVGGIGKSLIRDNSDYILDSIKRLKIGSDSFSVHFVRVRGFKFQFIEGVGSIENGLFYYEHREFESGSDLVVLCKEGDLMIYNDHEVVKTGKHTCQPVFFSNGVDELNGSSHLGIFPNPGNGVFTLSTDGFTSKDIQVVNGKGQLVYQATSTTSNEMDLGLLSPGIYQVLVKIDAYLLAQKLVVD